MPPPDYITDPTPAPLLGTIIARHPRRVEDLVRRRGIFPTAAQESKFLDLLSQVAEQPEIGPAGQVAELRRLFIEAELPFFESYGHTDQGRIARIERALTKVIGIAISETRPRSLLDIGGHGLFTGSIAESLGIRPQATVSIDTHRLIDPRLTAPDDRYTFLEEPEPDFITNLIEEHDRLREERFDLIVVSMILHHTADPDALLRSLAKRLSAKGRLVIREHDCPRLSEGSPVRFRDISGLLWLFHELHERIWPPEPHPRPNAGRYDSHRGWQARIEELALELTSFSHPHYADNRANVGNNFTAAYGLNA